MILRPPGISVQPCHRGNPDQSHLQGTSCLTKTAHNCGFTDVTIAPAQSLEHTTQAWWLASTRLHDCSGDEFTMRAVKGTMLALRLNEWSAKVAELADRALQQIYSRKRLV